MKNLTMCPYCTDMMESAEIDLHIKENHPALNQNKKLIQETEESIRFSPNTPEIDAIK